MRDSSKPAARIGRARDNLFSLALQVIHVRFGGPEEVGFSDSSVPSTVADRERPKTFAPFEGEAGARDSES
jgi:hypothetical protein